MLHVRSAHRLPVLVGSTAALATGCLAAAATAAAGNPIPALPRLALCLGLLFAGIKLHVSIRLGAQRVELAWGEAGLVLALAVVPAPWAVLLTPPAFLLCYAGRQPLVKIVYNTASYTIAAAVAATIVTWANVTRPFGFIGLVTLAAAGAAAGLVTYLAVAAVIAVVQDVPLLATWRVSAGLQVLTLAGNLGVAVAVLVLGQLDWRLVAALPPLVLCLHEGYVGRFRAAAERRAGQRKSVAISHLTDDLDEAAVLQRAAAEICTLLTADAVDILLPGVDGAPDLLYRHHRKDDPWTGPATDAPPLPARTVASVPLARPGEVPRGRLQVWLAAATADLRLSEWDEEALAILAVTATAALANARAHAEQTYHATHDRLTGLPIRGVLLGRIAGSADVQSRTSQHHPVALILVDLNGYKDLISNLGHDSAEHLLARTAAQLRGAVADGEFLAHIGGDDFGVYLDNAKNPAHVRRRTAALIEAVAEPYRIDAGTIQLDATAGVAYSATAVLDGAELLRQSMFALDHARADGAPVKFYDPGADQLGGPAATVMISELHAALDRSRLHLDFEPIIELTSRAPIAVETRVIWPHPDYRYLGPSELLAVAGHSPDHSRFLAWLLREALAARAGWDTDHDCPVSITLAFRCLLDPAFPQQVADALDQAGLPPDQLMLAFEFDDTRSLTFAAPASNALDELRLSGVRIAIDRFGRGAVSLSGLLELPATHLKIDPEFTENALHSKKIVGLAVDVARRSGLTVIAGGVPSDEHRTALAALGCDAGYGPYFTVFGQPIADYLITAPQLPPAAAKVISLDARRRDDPTF